MSQYKLIQRTAKDRLGVVLTNEQVEELLGISAPQSEVTSELMFYVGKDDNLDMDTADRDLLGDLLVERVLGHGYGLPRYGSPAAYHERFLQIFPRRAREKGFKTVDAFWPPQEPVEQGEEWLRPEGDRPFLYTLQGTGKYHKGEEFMENRLYLSISGAPRTPEEDLKQLTTQIHSFLNARAELKRVGLLTADGTLSLTKLMWMATDSPAAKDS